MLQKKLYAINRTDSRLLPDYITLIAIYIQKTVGKVIQFIAKHTSKFVLCISFVLSENNNKEI